MVAAALVTAAMLTGCSGGDGDEAEKGNAPSEKVIEIQDQPGSVEGYAGALEDSEVTSCEQRDGSLHVAGTVTNPEADTQDYRIYVSALDRDDTVGLVQLDVTGVDGGATADWSTDIAYGGDGLRCVLRVERFPSE